MIFVVFVPRVLVLPVVAVVVVAVYIVIVSLLSHERVISVFTASLSPSLLTYSLPSLLLHLTPTPNPTLPHYLFSFHMFFFLLFFSSSPSAPLLSITVFLHSPIPPAALPSLFSNSSLYLHSPPPRLGLLPPPPSILLHLLHRLRLSAPPLLLRL